MPFEKGHPKYGGRKKGATSPAKMRAEDVKQTFLRMGVNPIEMLCKIARSKKPVPEHKLKALAELCRYYAPRLSTQAITGRIDSNLQVTAAIQEIMLAADPATIKALESVSLKLDSMTRRAPHTKVIDVEPLALPEPEDEELVPQS